MIRPLLFLIVSSLIIFGLAYYAMSQPIVPPVPGTINPAVTQDNIHSTICVPGYTAKIRPPQRYTTTLKRKQFAQFHYKDHNVRHYEEDHLISLELGGNPTDPNNLWPQLLAGPCGARIKDKLETHLHTLVCTDQLDLTTAQQDISDDWVGAFNQYLAPLTCPPR